ncbi:metal ABC transporter substrate-binding protein [Terricaulis sp.]|uniref:metal ABC transporter substrate-binding protein n=1 Tax=Terricaulis sp. TaxID=2768686 RepID=UPI003783B5E5
MKRTLIAAALFAAASTVLATPAYANLNVFACEPEWGALATEIGGDRVNVYAATLGGQDPHQVQARPSLIARARAANVTVCTGAELEVAWLPLIIQQSGNSRLAPSQPGAFSATSAVRLLERPASVDRSQGDIHAAGNPHVQTDPRNMIPISRAMAQRFAQLDPANAQVYTARQADFERRWTTALARWQTRAAPLRGVAVAVQHRTWPYMLNWLGMTEVVALEPQPGVPPSAGYLAQTLQRLRTTPARFVIRAAYEDSRPSEFIAQRANIPAVVLPFTVGGTPAATNLFTLYDDTITRLLAGIGQ